MLKEKFFYQMPGESYDDFLKRVYSFEKTEFTFGTDYFVPSGSVSSKVDCNGNFKHFVGDTTVFNLGAVDKELIAEQYIEPLYEVAGDCFAEKFNPSTLHMTLHDLNATANNDYYVLERMLYTEFALAKVLTENVVRFESIKMKTTCVFNMVNTSLVLGFVPETNDDYVKLMALYNLVDSVLKLPYPLTPHVTLAYYNCHGFNSDKIQAIEKLVNKLNQAEHKVFIYTGDLYYQKFINMNEFVNVMPFVQY